MMTDETKDTQNHSITITDGRGWQPLRRMARTMIVLAFLFTPGVIFDSQAMQWLSFIVAILLAGGFAVRSAKNVLTIEQARKRLDELEARS